MQAALGVFGSLRINSELPLDTLVPARVVLENQLNRRQCVEATGPEGALLSLSASSAQETPDNPFLFEWDSSTGLTGQGKEFSIDLGLNDQEVVTVTVTDPTTNETATVSVPVCVSDTTPPLVTIISPVDGEVFHKSKIEIDLVIEDLVDKNITEYELVLGSRYFVSVDPVTGRSVEKLYKPDSTSDLIAQDLMVWVYDASGNRTVERLQVFIDDKK